VSKRQKIPNVVVRYIALLPLIFIYGCASLPEVDPADRPVSSAFTGETTLSKLASQHTSAYPGKSGFKLINQGKAAFIYRAQLADLAEKSIDAQYYIWHDDVTGKLLAARLLRAAGRGARIRLLLDDIGSGGSEKMLAMMDAHPNIDVRIYNPFRSGMRFGLRKLTSFLIEFSRLNLRMHNKTFTVDGSISIAGGRNIGDEYFDHHPEENFIDLDLLVIGDNVPEVAKSFDLYWNSQAAVPLSLLTRAPTNAAQKQAELLNLLTSSAERGYPWSIGESRKSPSVTDSFANLAWAESDFVYDQPLHDESQITADEKGVVSQRLNEEFSRSREEALIQSAYFIVLDKSLAGVKQVLDAGVDISVLTNSLVTNDLWLIHAGYSSTRQPLLQNGVKLYELRPDADSCEMFIEDEQICDRVKVSLHAKAGVLDRERLYVGSFNLNPRSAYLNTEMVFIIKSKILAQELANDILENMRANSSWQVTLDDQQQLEWVTRDNGLKVIYDSEPQASLWQRARNALFSIFPFDKYY
jgi:putative cardiolipin synthase